MSGRKTATPCRQWNGTPGSCQFGTKCRFSHTTGGDSGSMNPFGGLNSLGGLGGGAGAFGSNAAGSKQPCKFWKEGSQLSCREGQRCKFAHAGGGRAGDPPGAIGGGGFGAPFGGAKQGDPFRSNTGNFGSSSNAFGNSSNAFGNASNPFGNSSNPFGGGGASNPFGGAQTTTPFGFGGGMQAQSQGQGFGTGMGALGGGFGANPSQQMNSGAQSCGKDMRRDGGQGSCAEAVMALLNQSTLPSGLAEHRSGMKPWALSCFCHQNPATGAACDIEGDVSPEEARWEYIKRGGMGCGGASEAAKVIDGVIQKHVQALFAHVSSAQQRQQQQQQQQQPSVSANNLFGHKTLSPSTKVPLSPILESPFGTSAGSWGSSTGSAGAGNGGFASLLNAAALPAQPAQPPPPPEPPKVKRVALTAELKAKYLPSEIKQYEAPVFDSLENIPIFPLPHDCDLA